MFMLTKLIILGVAISVAASVTHAFAAPLIDIQDPLPSVVCAVDHHVPQSITPRSAAIMPCHWGSNASTLIEDVRK